MLTKIQNAVNIARYYARQRAAQSTPSGRYTAEAKRARKALSAVELRRLAGGGR